MPSRIAFPLLALVVVAAAVFPSASSQQPAAVPQPRGFYINCGSDKDVQVGSIKWVRDEGFTAVGNASTIDKPGLLPVLATLRHFPDATARKYCYQLPVVRGTRYLVRTTYFYGGFDGGKEPPVFDQIIDGTHWSAVNTTDNYRRGMSTYFEMVAEGWGKTLSVCLARRNETASSPFISALEVIDLDDSMYNTTDYEMYAMSTVARNRFGSKSEIVRYVLVVRPCVRACVRPGNPDVAWSAYISSYPDDQYNRYWAPFADSNPAVESHSPISPGDFWNQPPAKALKSGVTTSRGKKLTVRWPTAELPAATYYVALYFQDSRTASPYSWRVFDVAVNGKEFFRGLNASAAGVMVYSNMMQLSGKMEIVLTPNETSPVGPLINAGEIYQIVPLGGKTATRDVVAMGDLARSLNNPPPDWAGDPCLPQQHSWTGVECSQGSLVRVLSLDLKNHGLSGSLSDSMGNLTGMKTIYLNNNNLTGKIPDSLKNKAGLDLRTEGNKFE
ncbi:putative leucine-rich repeat receptor-like serine/threonine-protein kinase [Dichanthelium oligosanthes]|uniref:Putative leucine-rich repeat receptor-like serine/threonine-protein kinase n=1 Tax=Dichanthelium oligosanthes TaxID=888268 RepID=A0A1E5URF2_9POAL|nr:putative leucine-rich repeat receptor-like serine/threonine-protein kinase [Dichanthelium oligosanthes]